MVISNLKIGTSYFFYPLSGICERKYTLPTVWFDPNIVKNPNLGAKIKRSLSGTLSLPKVLVEVTEHK